MKYLTEKQIELLEDQLLIAWLKLKAAEQRLTKEQNNEISHHVSP